VFNKYLLCVHQVKDKLVFIIILAFSICSLFSQESLFNEEIKKLADKNQSTPYFYKAASFFTKESLDSTLVFSMRYLNTSNNSVLS